MKLPKASTDGDKPKSLKESIYTFTPVALTVLSTLLAGLSSSEMTRSQYFRAMAAQEQSKASDQWNYYQAKRMRAVEAENSLDLLNATTPPPPFDAAVMKKVAPDFAQAPIYLQTSPSGGPADQPIPDPNVQDAVKAVDQLQTESQMAPLLHEIDDSQMDDAIKTAQANLDAYDKYVGPGSDNLEQLRRFFSNSSQTSARSVEFQGMRNSITAARLDYAARRYDKEAGYNHVLGDLYEVQVHRRSVESERRKARSGGFFYGMLAAQAGVIVAGFALAVQRKGELWLVGAVAGICALGTGGYVYWFF